MALDVTSWVGVEIFKLHDMPQSEHYFRQTGWQSSCSIYWHMLMGSIAMQKYSVTKSCIEEEDSTHSDKVSNVCESSTFCSSSRFHGKKISQCIASK